MIKIADIDQLKNGDCCFIELTGRALLLLRSNDRIYLYDNKCPHARKRLDEMQSSVISSDGLLLTCRQHGAQFLSDSGLCVSGPCQGLSLNAVEFDLQGESIYIDA